MFVSGDGVTWSPLGGRLFPPVNAYTHYSFDLDAALASERLVRWAQARHYAAVQAVVERMTEDLAADKNAGRRTAGGKGTTT